MKLLFNSQTEGQSNGHKVKYENNEHKKKKREEKD